MKNASRVFGAENDKLSEYQKKVNDASCEICKQKPSLLFGKKGDIVTMAREKVHSDVYVYKKGSSCSKNLVQDKLMWQLNQNAQRFVL